MTQADEDYVKRCLDGEPYAYRLLVQRHQGAVTAYLTSRLGSADMAEEAAQEAFVRAYFSLGKLRKGNSFLPWLISIAVRVGHELVRDRQRARTMGTLPDVPAATEPVKSTQEESLAKAVGRLPAVYQDAIRLRYHAGLSCAEMSEHLGIPVGSVTKRLSRAYALLREAMARQERGREGGEVKQ